MNDITDVLLVGGPEDGRRLTLYNPVAEWMCVPRLPSDRFLYSSPVSSHFESPIAEGSTEELGAMQLEVSNYRRIDFFISDLPGRVSIWAWSALSARQAFDRLLTNYRPLV